MYPLLANHTMGDANSSPIPLYNFMEIERFFFDNPGIELETNEDQPTRVTGYAMKIDIVSHDRSGYRDVFLPDVFGESLTGSGGLGL